MSEIKDSLLTNKEIRKIILEKRLKEINNELPNLKRDLSSLELEKNMIIEELNPKRR